MLGTAFAFNILLKIPVWAGVILTVFSTLLLLGVQRFGVWYFIYNIHSHTEEVRIQYLEDGLAYPLTKTYICAPHHTGPQTGVRHSGFHVHHGGLLLRGAELPEAVRGRGCQGHVRPQAPRERRRGQRDRALRRHHHAVSNQPTSTCHQRDAVINF